ncbi:MULTISPECIES: NYN domain-containing protein [unclassified Neorhizobium]|uniref:NYN domain-containing protein n=1 Tax=unclassified Neorhizobium TaxID=2629175 RepID=UPI001FF6CE9B|nr:MULTISPECIES: NYN domain-containing protein [unclassified Neorhizobium]MCJ9672107.1 NYN domain-containing protein [Neorhizobium sp. SHOUNA12B]MCJ9748002.1 NYN domain-containing protein [Neorhizobium sp. SHOUNA12A]
MLYSTGYSGPSGTSYMFVDAASLRGYTANISRRFFNEYKFEFDLKRVASGYSRVFYYDALPIRERNEEEAIYLARTAEQREILEQAAAVDGVHVYEGDAHRRKNKSPGGLEQKKVDVMIAVDMLTHTFRRNMHQAALLTGDNDFKPLVDALVREGMQVTLWYPPGETNKELVNAADSRRALDLQVLWNWMTDESRINFRIPQPVNINPSIERGVLISEWVHESVRFQLRKDGEQYVVLRDGDQLNRLRVTHENYDLLSAFCVGMGYPLPSLQTKG